jgi:hypothetical protein
MGNVSRTVFNKIESLKGKLQTEDANWDKEERRLKKLLRDLMV